MNVEFGMEIEIGNREIVVSIDAKAKIYKDHYGADADGNRGEFRTEMDDLVIIVKDLSNRDVTEKLRRKYPNQYDEIEDTAITFLLQAFEEES
ncbi:unnamed protein product [Sphagnum jensenii]|uniref:Uncharacterized protein n=1 Tax=Sphagnum jensenii TaxID=128206 RepID=A0ABP0VAV5_9BRYO